MRYVAATVDPNHFLSTVANVLMGFGGGLAALVLIVTGFKVLIKSGHSGGSADTSSGIRDAFDEAGKVLVALFFIFGAFFMVGVITAVVHTLQK